MTNIALMRDEILKRMWPAQAKQAVAQLSENRNALPI